MFDFIFPSVSCLREFEVPDRLVPPENLLGSDTPDIVSAVLGAFGSAALFGSNICENKSLHLWTWSGCEWNGWSSTIRIGSSMGAEVSPTMTAVTAAASILLGQLFLIIKLIFTYYDFIFCFIFVKCLHNLAGSEQNNDSSSSSPATLGTAVQCPQLLPSQEIHVPLTISTATSHSGNSKYHEFDASPFLFTQTANDRAASGSLCISLPKFFEAL